MTVSGDLATLRDPFAMPGAQEAAAARVEAEIARLEREQETLVTLVRVGFLVSVNGERAGLKLVNEPEARRMLLAILEAEDVDAAVEALRIYRKEGR